MTQAGLDQPVDRRFDQPVGGRFDRRQHRFPVRVYFEDTDLSGVVYHANYLRYLERARSDMLRLAGVDQRRTFEAGQGAYAVASLNIRYLAPARLDDALLVVSDVVQVGAARVVIHQRVMRDDVLIAAAEVVAALVGPDGRPNRQPSAWIEIYKSLLGQGEPLPS
jgi:acyl-CoA thioester hydrolase